MNKETKKKLIAVITDAIDSEDYWTMGKVGALLVRMNDNNETLNRIINADEVVSTDPF